MRDETAGVKFSKDGEDGWTPVIRRRIKEAQK